MNHPSSISSSAPLLAAEDLSISFGGAPVLDSVNLAVRPREIVTLIGPNGSGKTTLIRALLGLTPVSGGRAVRNTARIGYVPQGMARDKSLPLTALRFCRSFGGGTNAEAIEMLTRAGVAHAANSQLSSLSGGEFARVALARALLRRPDVLVLDEPLAGVDLAGEASLYTLIAAARDEIGAAILIVSHDLHIVMAAADRVICLNRHICCQGDAQSVARDPAFIALFGERVAEQIALYSHRHDHTHAPSGAIEPSSPSHAREHRHG